MICKCLIFIIYHQTIEKRNKTINRIMKRTEKYTISFNFQKITYRMTIVIR
jgi:hypothetical protein